MEKRKKWWNLSVFEYSFKAIFLRFLSSFSLIAGIILGADNWFFDLNTTFESQDLILPFGLLAFGIFFSMFRKLAKKEYQEKALGNGQS